jgi:hypothetical protein
MGSQKKQRHQKMRRPLPRQSTTATTTTTMAMISAALMNR